MTGFNGGPFVVTGFEPNGFLPIVRRDIIGPKQLNFISLFEDAIYATPEAHKVLENKPFKSCLSADEVTQIFRFFQEHLLVGTNLGKALSGCEERGWMLNAFCRTVFKVQLVLAKIHNSKMNYRLECPRVAYWQPLLHKIFKERGGWMFHIVGVVRGEGNSAQVLDLMMRHPVPLEDYLKQFSHADMLMPGIFPIENGHMASKEFQPGFVINSLNAERQLPKEKDAIKEVFKFESASDNCATVESPPSVPEKSPDELAAIRCIVDQFTKACFTKACSDLDPTEYWPWITTRV
ncbi:MAG: hypothetical protein KGR16_06290 [Verrucomicrobia bacterium]|nr:hypothetical protein [Verrucomicrobiota bacterium]